MLPVFKVWIHKTRIYRNYLKNIYRYKFCRFPEFRQNIFYHHAVFFMWSKLSRMNVVSWSFRVFPGRSVNEKSEKVFRMFLITFRQDFLEKLLENLGRNCSRNKLLHRLCQQKRTNGSRTWLQNISRNNERMFFF